jgi:hypothetical protein
MIDIRKQNHVTLTKDSVLVRKDKIEVLSSPKWIINVAESASKIRRIARQ